VHPPFFYGWVVIAVAFATMAIGVNARTSFSLLFPPILDEFSWERGITAAAVSMGFLVSAKGKHYGSVFGVLSLAASAGAGTGPWVTGVLHDRTGTYVLAFWLAIAFSAASVVCIWRAAPRKVRAVAGRVPARR
jgi:cyanate permease